MSDFNSWPGEEDKPGTQPQPPPPSQPLIAPPVGSVDHPPPPRPRDTRVAAVETAMPVRPIVPSDDFIVQTSGVTKRYGQLNAVDSVSLNVKRGSITGLIGPNGAGKTTLMTMVASLLRPSAGLVSVDGFDPAAESVEVRRLTGYMPDGLGVYEGLDVGGYLEFFAGAYRIPSDEWAPLIEGLLELVALEVKRDAPVNSLSRGMKQRLSLARSLVHDPSLLLLDEPASGLDPRARIELRELLWQLQSMGKTIIVSSHILSELQEICSDVAIMEAGRLLAEGSPNEIIGQLGGQRKIRVTFSDGEIEEFPVVDTDEQVALIRRLVNSDDRAVLEVREVSGGLEDVFMSVTKGIVQ